MLNRRHHIHLICDSEDTSLFLARDKIAVFFEQRAFFTRDLLLSSPDSANYSWRCINNCDYVIMLIGRSYGKVNASGVSQLHVSYLNAKTKNKPVIALIRRELGSVDRKLTDLMHLIERQLEHTYHFDDEDDFMELFDKVYSNLVTHYPTNGWIGKNALEASLQAEAVITQSTQNSPSNNKISSMLNSGDKATSRIQLAPSLQDELMVSCSVHAYRGGNLSEMAFMASIRWQQLLLSLASSSIPFTQQSLWRKLNELVTPQALPSVQRNDASIHAVSRCQVGKSDMLWVKNELLAANWIAPTEPNKDLWLATETAKKLVQQSA
ncbi:MAG: hypothetical protein Q4G13_03165 [Moraxella sp.]|nr:hypothetical protein [Moraxella sp.]